MSAKNMRNMRMMGILRMIGSVHKLFFFCHPEERRIQVPETWILLPRARDQNDGLFGGFNIPVPRT